MEITKQKMDDVFKFIGWILFVLYVRVLADKEHDSEQQTMTSARGKWIEPTRRALKKKW